MSPRAWHLRDAGALTTLRFAASTSGQANLSLPVGIVLSAVDSEPGDRQMLDAAPSLNSSVPLDMLCKAIRCQFPQSGFQMTSASPLTRLL